MCPIICTPVIHKRKRAGALDNMTLGNLHISTKGHTLVCREVIIKIACNLLAQTSDSDFYSRLLTIAELKKKNRWTIWGTLELSAFFLSILYCGACCALSQLTHLLEHFQSAFFILGTPFHLTDLHYKGSALPFPPGELVLGTF